VLNGWKAKSGGIGLILTGLGVVASALASESVDYTQIIEGVIVACNGLGIFGIRVAIDRYLQPLQDVSK
jgi:hypothetical protein